MANDAPNQTTPASEATVPPGKPWKYQDPVTDPGRKGMLLSNEIERFCEQGLLISKNYCRRQLRPAAYTLRIGEDYVDSTGKRKRLSEKNPSFYIAPNSIAYVSTFESLDLPYYIVARFNLRVKWVYKGILLGTGPQVEPGYSGFLSCPLFNLTATPIRVTYRDSFATIDFERTTDFCRGEDSKWISQNIQQSKEMPDFDEILADSKRFLLFRQDPAYPALKHLPEWNVVSSLTALSNEVKMWRNIGVAIFIAFISLTLSLLGFQSNLYRDVRALDARLSESRQMEGSLEARVRALALELAEARAAMRALETRVTLVDQQSNKRTGSGAAREVPSGAPTAPK